MLIKFAFYKLYSFIFINNVPTEIISHLIGENVWQNSEYSNIIILQYKDNYYHPLAMIELVRLSILCPFVVQWNNR